MRYFREEDEENAKEVARIAAGYFTEKCPPAREFPTRYDKKPLPQIEVSVSINCGGK